MGPTGPKGPVSPCGPSGPSGPTGPCRTGRTTRTLRSTRVSLWSLRSCGSCRSCHTLGSCRSCLALGSCHALRSLSSCRSGFTLRSLSPCRSFTCRSCEDCDYRKGRDSRNHHPAPRGLNCFHILRQGWHHTHSFHLTPTLSFNPQAKYHECQGLRPTIYDLTETETVSRGARARGLVDLRRFFDRVTCLWRRSQSE